MADNISQVTSPHGRWINFNYARFGEQVISATDDMGRTVNYYYNGEDATGGENSTNNCGLAADTGPSGTMACVQDADGHDTVYDYDSNGWMNKVVDARRNTIVSNVYDSNARVDSADDRRERQPYTFSYELDGNGLVTQSTMTSPNGNETVTNLDSNGFPTSMTRAPAPRPPTPRLTSASRDEFLTSQTDQSDRRDDRLFL